MSNVAMTAAMNAAEKSNHSKWKLGSVVWRGGSIISTGHNSVRNDPAIVENEKYFNCTTHAEVAAIKNAGNTAGAKLFVARLTRSGNVGLARPCSRCLKVIKTAGIRKVYYTGTDGSWKVFKVWP